MSKPDDRQSALTQRRWAELLQQLEYERRRAEDERRKLRSQREIALRQWFMQHLETTQPAPDQPFDTLLGGHYGDLNLTKRAGMATATLRITNLERLPDGAMLITATGAIAGALKKGLRKLGEFALTQMRNRGLGSAGEVRSARVEKGIARVVARISSAIAATKVEHRVYPALDMTYDDEGTIYSVDLVDRPSGDVLAKRGITILAKLYRKEDEVKLKKSAKDLDKAARALIGTPIVPDSGDPERRRLMERAGIELVKAAMLRGPSNDWRLTMGRGR
jgi:hypothetical protein